MRQSVPSVVCSLAVAFSAIAAAQAQQDRDDQAAEQVREQDFDESNQSQQFDPDRAQSNQFDQQQLNQRPDQFDQQFERQSEREFDQQSGRQGFDQSFDNRDINRQQQMQRDSFERLPRGEEFRFGAEFSDGQQDGLRVTSINQGTIAAQIGLQERDQIVSVGGRTVTSADELNQVLVRNQSAGERIPVVVRRGGQQTTLFIQPDLMRETFVLSGRQFDPDLGFTLVPGADDRLVVQQVTGGLADVIGLRRSDVIVSVGGRIVSSPAQFTRFIYSADPSLDRIPVVVLRNGQRIVLYVEPNMLEYRQFDRREFVERGPDAWLGVSLDTRYQDAAVVRRVVPDSPADHAGVQQGDWITSINGRRVSSPDHLINLISSLAPGDEVELQLSRRINGSVYATLEGERFSEPRQALRPTYEFEQPEVRVQTGQERYYRGDVIGEFDTDFDRRGVRDRFGPGERGLWDRFDRDELPDEPRGLRRP